MQYSSEDEISYDVVIVGAGPAGLSAAIKLKQLALQNNKTISVCIIEKGSQVGSHIMSGAILDPISLYELIPNWQEKFSLGCRVVQDRFVFLTKNNLIDLLVPPYFHNKGNYIISLGLLCKNLAHEAENLGVDIYSGFAGSDLLYDEKGFVKGIITGDMGIDKNGNKLSNFVSGIKLLSKQVIIAEGCRGSLAKKLISNFNLDKKSEAQTYGIGIKEIWQIDSKYHKEGLVMHSIGWPLDFKTYGGSFLYHMSDNKISVGFVIGLDYTNPYLSPFDEFQKFKTHPKIKFLFECGQRISYGSRAICEGGVQSLPKISFPGGVLIGDSAGFLNVARIKGIHGAMKSAILAASAIFEEFSQISNSGKIIEVFKYNELFENSWLYNELYKIRNIRPVFKWYLPLALFYCMMECYIFKGRSFWTIKHKGADYLQLKHASKSKKINYSVPDGKITFDITSSIFLSNIQHAENQPNHLKLIDPKLSIEVNFKKYASPETRFCPAGVYEIIKKDSNYFLQIHSQNCIHCKTCDIKDPVQNINWVCPEGGAGPNYSAM